MRHSSTPTLPLPLPISELLRQVVNQPLLVLLKHGIRELQTLLNYDGFQQLKHLASTLPLGALLERRPRFAYKYLSRYSAASFSRRTRLAVLLNHYRILAATLRPEFFGLLQAQPTLWQSEGGEFTITLSYPHLVGFESELSLNFLVGGVLVPVVGFVAAPAGLVGTAGRPASCLPLGAASHVAEVFLGAAGV